MLEERLEFPIEQTRGIVRADFWEEKKRGPKLTIQEWMYRIKHNVISLPYVASNGVYTKRGLKKKLRATNRIIRFLERQNALRLDTDKSRTTNKVYTNLSIANTISSASNRNIEEILLEDTHYNREKYSWEPHHHIKVLWSAYLGDRWFETFKEIQRRKIESRELKLPVLYEWQIIPRAVITRILKVSQKTFQELNKTGFLIPMNYEKFKSRSNKNFVHMKALAQFFALLEDTQLSRKFIPKERDNNYQDILAGINNKRLIPYLRENGLVTNRDYSVKELSEKTGIAESIIRSWIFMMKAIPFTRENYTEKRTRVLIKGIDFAFYALKGEERKKQMSKKDIAELFAIKEKQVESLHLPPVKELYGSQQYVYPLYDVFCFDIRRKYIK